MSSSHPKRKKALLYFPLDLDQKNHGIANKCLGIIEAFKEKYHTDYINSSPFDIKLNGKTIHTFPQQGITKKLFFIYERLFGYYRLHHALLQKEKYDILYLRFHYFITLEMLMFFYQLKKNQPQAKIFVEIPTYPYKKELYNTMAYIRYGFNFVVLPWFKKWVDFIVTVSAHDKIYGIPTIKTSNGYYNRSYDINIQIEKRTPPAPNPFVVGLVANFSPWHAPEILIQSIAEYYQLSNINDIEVKAIMIGDGETLEKCKQLAQHLGLTKHISFPGRLDFSEINAYSQKIHVMIGTLGHHLKNIKLDSSLKNREYAFMGMPMILKTPDPDFPETLPFIKYFKDDESLIDINEVISFYKKLAINHPNYPQEINEYARKHLTWQAKLKEVFYQIDL